VPHDLVPRRTAELRRRKGWSQEKLAYTSGVSVSTISAMERGVSVLPGTAAKVADTLGVSIFELYGVVPDEADDDAHALA
jgi:transcriptional regulator with XRE-family HTH domain